MVTPTIFLGFLLPHLFSHTHTHTHAHTLLLIFTCVHWHVISQNIPTGYVFHVEVFNYSRRDCPLPRCRCTNYYGPKCLYHFQITVLSTVYEHFAITLIPFMLKRNTHEQQRTIIVTYFISYELWPYFKSHELWHLRPYNIVNTTQIIYSE